MMVKSMKTLELHYPMIQFLIINNYSPKAKWILLYNNQISTRAVIGQSAVGYRAGKPTEKSGVFWIII